MLVKGTFISSGTPRRTMPPKTKAKKQPEKKKKAAIKAAVRRRPKKRESFVTEEAAEPSFMESFIANLNGSVSEYMSAQQAGRAAAGLPPLQGPSYEAFVAFCTRSLATGKFDAEEFTKQGLDAWTLQNAYMYLAKSEFGRKILNAVGMPVGEPPQPQQMMGMPVGEERMWPPQQQQRMLVGPPQQGIMPAQPHGMPQRPPPGHYHSRPLPPPGHYRSLPPLPPPDGEWKQLADDAYQKKEGGLFSFLWK